MHNFTHFVLLLSVLNLSLANCYFDRFCRPPRRPNAVHYTGGE